MKKVKCIMSHAKLTNTYWVEALTTIVYIINMSPFVPLVGDVPHRVWTGKDVSYRQLRVFGYLAYVRVAKDQRIEIGQQKSTMYFLRVR